MGIAKQLVQSIIFNSIKQNNYGLILQNEIVNKPDVIIFDHMLVMHSICYIPAMEGTVEEHVIKQAVKYYMKYYRQHGTASTIIVLCEDGKQCVKPAVREKRNDQEPTEALVFFKQNKKNVARKILEQLHQESVATIYLTGHSVHDAVSGQCFSKRHVKKPLEVEIQLKQFMATCKESESDTLMFAYAAHHRVLFAHHLIMIVTKDSDVIPSGLVLAAQNGGEFLGNLIVEFKTPMLSFLKDFDRAVSDFKWNIKPTAEEEKMLTKLVHYPDSAFIKQCGMDLDKQLFYMALDTGSLEPFESQLLKLEAQYYANPEMIPSLVTFINYCCKRGFRGPIFRRILLRLVDDNPDTVKKVKDFMASINMGCDSCELLKAFLGSTSTYVAIKTPRKIKQSELFSMECGTIEPEWSDAFQTCGTKEMYRAQDEAMSLRAIRQTIALSKLYLNKQIPFGTYGYFIKANNISGVKYVRFAPTDKTMGVIVAAILAGADYNMSVAQLGIAQLSTMMANSDYNAFCKQLTFSTQHNGPKIIQRLLEYTRINATWPDKKEIDSYYTCIWKTLCYTIDTWCLKAPTPSLEYGYVTVDGVYKFMFNYPELFKKSFKLGKKRY